MGRLGIKSTREKDEITSSSGLILWRSETFITLDIRFTVLETLDSRLDGSKLFSD